MTVPPCHDAALYAAATVTHQQLPAYGCWIAEQWQHPTQYLPMQCPATQQQLAFIACGDAATVDAAVQAAKTALSPWAALSARQRGYVLYQYAQLIQANAHRLAWLEAYDTGKPIVQARADILAAVRYFEFYGAAADKVHGEVIPYLPNHNVQMWHEPHGVTAHVIPWNYPAQMFARSIAPALAMGNTVVLKPAEDACLSILEMVAMTPQAGLPAGVLNVVTGTGAEAGAALTSHPEVNFIAFTGSAQVGITIQQAAAANHVPLMLELGGKSPQLIFEDALLARAAQNVCRAIIQNAGQTCSAGSRVLIQRTIYASFVELLKQNFTTLRLGSPDSHADVGPLINAKQYQRAMAYLQMAAADALPILLQVSVPQELNTGYFVPPTVFAPVAPNHILAQKELFAPFLIVHVFDSEEEALHIANSTPYGLVAGVWTNNAARQHRLARQLRVGQVFINCYGAGGGVELPFGGVKHSGYGREKGLQALKAWSISKTVVQEFGE